MFERKTVMFLYAISPVHMGTGTDIGYIDNPIQRECHTGHPCFAGSGIKGAVRHQFELLGGDESLKVKLFGPDSNSSSLHAGAISFGDAQIIAFPVRSAKHSFVYATSSQALARTHRLIMAMVGPKEWKIPTVPENQSIVINQEVLFGNKLRLESFEYTAITDDTDDESCSNLKRIASEIAEIALPSDEDKNGYFAEKFQNHLVLLPDSDFTFFVENATFVESHVRINDETGVADDGGLFYTENLPPESLLISPLLASSSRNSDGDTIEADEVICKIRNVVDGKLVQLGGDATTGRGLVVARIHDGGGVA